MIFGVIIRLMAFFGYLIRFILLLFPLPSFVSGIFIAGVDVDWNLLLVYVYMGIYACCFLFFLFQLL